MKIKLVLSIIVFTIMANAIFAQDSWTQKANLAGIARVGAVGFSIGDKGYLGTGYGLPGPYQKDFWEYDPTANVWTQKADFAGAARVSAIGFSIGTKGYIGTGFNGARLGDFWEYDPGTNAWIQKADLAGGPRDAAVGFSIGSKGYVGTGVGTDGSPRTDFWEFDPAINVWTQKSNFIGTARYYATAFSLSNKGYIGTGTDGAFSYKNDFFEYDPALNAWTQKANFGGSQRLEATSFAIAGKGYIGTGYDNTWKDDFWEFDPVLNNWTQKQNFSGAGRSGMAGFVIGNKGYIGTGAKAGDDPVRQNDLWEYNPATTVTICNQTWMTNNLSTSSYRNGDPIPQVTDLGQWNALTTGAWCYYNNDPSTEAVYGKLYNWYAVNDPRGLAPTGWHIPNNAEWITLENCAGGFFVAGGALKEAGNLHWASPNTGATNSSGFTALPGGIRQPGGSFGSMGNLGYWWSSNSGQYTHYGILFKGGYYRSIYTGSAIFYGNENYTGLYETPISEFTSGLSVRCVKDCIPHFSTCPSDQTRYTGTDNCVAPVNYTATVTGTTDPVISYAFSGATTGSGSGTGSGQSFRRGTTMVTIIAAGSCGMDSCKFIITVKDSIPPVVTCPPAQNICYKSSNTYSIPQVTATDNCGVKNISYTISGATNRIGVGTDASGIFNPGDNFIKWTVKDSADNTTTCETAVTIRPKFTANIPDSYGALFGRPNTIYIGYGWYIATAQQLFGNGFNAMLLTVIPSGGTPFQLAGIPYYHYRWSNGSTTPFTVISHTTAGTFTYSVTITDALGCEVTVQKSIRVINVQCNKNVFGINIPGLLVCRPGNKQACVYKFMVLPEVLRNAEIGPCGAGASAPLNAKQTPAQTATRLLSATANGNEWKQKTDFAGEARYGASSFSIGNKGYIGLGSSNDKFYNDFWEYDPNTGTWTQKADFAGTPRALATAFSINKKGYVGTGLDTDGLRNDFWEYNPSTNSWVKKADFNGGARVYATGFSIGSNGYIGTGYDMFDNYKNDFWEYNAAGDTWIRRANFGGSSRYMATGFSIGSKGYIGTGTDIEKLKNDFWEYNPATDSWIRKADFTGSARCLATGFTIGNRGFIGTGYDTTNAAVGDLWEYNPSSNSWLQKADFAGGPRMNATSFSIGGKAYLGTGFDVEMERNDFWEYAPTCYMEATIPDVYPMLFWGQPNTLYIGFGPAELTLSAIPSDGTKLPGGNYAYSWSNGATTKSINIHASTAGSFNYSVTINDALGCQSTVTKTINVVDVRCGNKMNKVTVCWPNRYGNIESCLTDNQAFLALLFGARLGSCNNGSQRSIEPAVTDAVKGISIFPNPNNGSFVLQLTQLSNVEVRVLDQNGRIISRQIVNGGNSVQRLIMNLGRIANGVYLVEAISKEAVYTSKIVVQQ